MESPLHPGVIGHFEDDLDTFWIIRMWLWWKAFGFPFLLLLQILQVKRHKCEIRTATSPPWQWLDCTFFPCPFPFPLTSLYCFPLLNIRVGTWPTFCSLKRHLHWWLYIDRQFPNDCSDRITYFCWWLLRFICLHWSFHLKCDAKLDCLPFPRNIGP